MKAVKFKNFTDEAFSWPFDGAVHTFEAGQEIYLEDFKAVFFAKHLADRECNKAGIPTNNPQRKVFESQCFPSDEPVSVAEAIDIEETKKAVAKKKGGKKKVVEVEAEEFADLNEEKNAE